MIYESASVYILDTDALGEIFNRGQQTILGKKVATVPRRQLFISIITLEEMLWGRTNAIKEVVKQTNVKEEISHDLPKLCRAFQETLVELSKWNVLPFDEAARAYYDSIPKNVRKGKLNDCRIAAVALTHDYTVVTKNVKDFSPISDACGVKFVDWSVTPLI
jgi:tRNA(fMet)-specific endonuclease VapC